MKGVQKVKENRRNVEVVFTGLSLSSLPPNPTGL